MRSATSAIAARKFPHSRNETPLGGRRLPLVGRLFLRPTDRVQHPRPSAALPQSLAAMAYLNAIRIAGDISHMLSFVALLSKIHLSKSVAGVSLKTQVLYVVVFCTRYVDLFWNHISMYNSVLKVIFIVLSLTVVYIIKRGVPQKATYDPELDSFPARWLLLPCALLAIVINQEPTSAFEILWAFSVYLEAVAILPQLHMVQKHGEVENLTAHYIFFLGLYRVFYGANWVYRRERAVRPRAGPTGRRPAPPRRALVHLQVSHRGGFLAAHRLGGGRSADRALLGLFLQFPAEQTGEPLPASSDHAPCVKPGREI